MRHKKMIANKNTFPRDGMDFLGIFLKVCRMRKKKQSREIRLIIYGYSSAGMVSFPGGPGIDWCVTVSAKTVPRNEDKTFFFTDEVE